jgi:RNA polymerase sigma-70 factor (ECF subfamily)
MIDRKNRHCRPLARTAIAVAGASVPAYPLADGIAPPLPLHPDWRQILLRLLLALDRQGTAPTEAREPRPGEAEAESPWVTAADRDQDLLDRVLDEYPHSTRWFAVLVSRHWERIWSLCQAILLNQEDADEATQDTFLKVHRYLLSFRGESRFATWANRIARNSALNLLASRGRDRRAEDRVIGDPTLLDWWRPWKAPDPSRRVFLLERALRALHADERTVLILRELEDVPYDEIAVVMGISAGATRMKALRAREKLRRRLQRLDGGSS